MLLLFVVVVDVVVGVAVAVVDVAVVVVDAGVAVIVMSELVKKVAKEGSG